MIVIQGSILLKDSDDEILLTLAVAYCVLRRPESRNYIIDDVTSLKSMIRPAR